MKFPGLPSGEVAQSRTQHQFNVFTPPERAQVWKEFISTLEEHSVRIVIIAAVISFGVNVIERHSFEPLDIVMALLLASGLTFWNRTRGDGNTLSFRWEFASNYQIVGEK